PGRLPQGLRGDRGVHHDPAERRPGAVGVRHRTDPRLRRRAHPRDRDLDVHLADGQPGAAHPHVRRAAQDRAPVNLTERLRHRKPQGPQGEFFSHQTSYPFMATRKVWSPPSAVLLTVSLASSLPRAVNLTLYFT